MIYLIRFILVALGFIDIIGTVWFIDTIGIAVIPAIVLIICEFYAGFKIYRNTKQDKIIYIVGLMMCIYYILSSLVMVDWFVIVVRSVVLLCFMGLMQQSSEKN